MGISHVTLQAQALLLHRDSDAWAEAQASYLARFPRAEQTFALGDFLLLRLQPVRPHPWPWRKAIQSRPKAGISIS